MTIIKIQNKISHETKSKKIEFRAKGGRAMKLIVSAHGMLAKEVVNSAGMVFGAIDDLDIVTFVPGENAETLKARYKELIDGYKEDEEILFLCRFIWRKSL